MSELRQDPVSGDWVIVAPVRAARPRMLDTPKPPRKPGPIATCPFEDSEHSGNLIEYAWPNKKNWRVIVTPNKYPAVTRGTEVKSFHDSLYYAKTGVGNHDLIITRDHTKNFADIPRADALKVFEVIQDRYHAAMADGSSRYVVPFFNWGVTAGASLWHPHYQVLSIPAVPAHTTTSLENAKKYFVKHKRCLRCDIIAMERASGARVIDENARAIAVAPYASKTKFEVMVLPKRHASYFRDADPGLLRNVVAILQSVMKRLRRQANDPDLNFFIHDAPLGPKKYAHHHWHIEVLPRISIPAGFEFSTGMYINQLPPEEAAKILRG